MCRRERDAIPFSIIRNLNILRFPMKKSRDLRFHFQKSQSQEEILTVEISGHFCDIISEILNFSEIQIWDFHEISEKKIFMEFQANGFENGENLDSTL